MGCLQMSRRRRYCYCGSSNFRAGGGSLQHFLEKQSDKRVEVIYGRSGAISSNGQGNKSI